MQRKIFHLTEGTERPAGERAPPARATQVSRTPEGQVAGGGCSVWEPVSPALWPWRVGVSMGRKEGSGLQKLGCPWG